MFIGVDCQQLSWLLVNEHLEVPGTNWGYSTSTERTRMLMKRLGEEGYAHEPIRPRLHTLVCLLRYLWLILGPVLVSSIELLSS